MYILITVGSMFFGKRIETPGSRTCGPRDGVLRLRRRRSPARSPGTARRRRLRRARHLRARDGVPGRVRALLLRQLEVPVDGLAAEVRPSRTEARGATMANPMDGAAARRAERRGAGRRGPRLLGLFKLRIGVVIALHRAGRAGGHARAAAAGRGRSRCWRSRCCCPRPRRARSTSTSSATSTRAWRARAARPFVTGALAAQPRAGCG